MCQRARRTEPTGAAIEEEDEGGRPRYAFPELDAQIRVAISEYEAVFPKLNFTSPKDASWMVASSSPLKCTSPADIYLLLKSSDFTQHDLSPESVFEGCEDASNPPRYELELVLRKWYHVDTSREFRCFVRQGVLIGISQRDPNPYDYMLESNFKEKVKETISSFWKREILGKWATDDYVFDFLLTRNIDSGHIIDFQPFAPKTDALLFSYEELEDLRRSDSQSLPEIRVVDGSTDPSRTAPRDVHNRVPMEFLSLSAGQTVEDFTRMWQEQIQKATTDSDSDSDDSNRL